MSFILLKNKLRSAEWGHAKNISQNLFQPITGGLYSNAIFSNCSMAMPLCEQYIWGQYIEQYRQSEGNVSH